MNGRTAATFHTSCRVMNRTKRPRLTAAFSMKMKSGYDACVAARITAPSSGRCSAPVHRTSNPSPHNAARPTLLTKR